VEDVQAFGDRLHIRVKENRGDDVLSRLRTQILTEGGQVDELRPVSPILEDVFIALSESESMSQDIAVAPRRETLSPGEHS
jgi:hypothetical protein